MSGILVGLVIGAVLWGVMISAALEAWLPLVFGIALLFLVCYFLSRERSPHE
jgi:uncharacterized membrane protein YfcA